MAKLTPEQIEEFKVEESEASDSWDFRVLAFRVSEVKHPDYYVGNKNWAKRLLKKAEEIAIDFDDFSSLGRVISTGDILGDWVTSNIDLANLEQNSSFYDGIVVSKKHKDWGRKLFKKAEELASTSEELNILATYVDGLYDEMSPELNENDILKDKKWSQSLRTKADNR